MDENKIPFIAFESIIGRMENVNRRLWILCILLISVLVFTNLGWVIYEAQFTDEMSVEQEVDTGEGDAIVNGIGDLIYGEGKTKGN